MFVGYIELSIVVLFLFLVYTHLTNFSRSCIFSGERLQLAEPVCTLWSRELQSNMGTLSKRVVQPTLAINHHPPLFTEDSFIVRLRYQEGQLETTDRIFQRHKRVN